MNLQNIIDNTKQMLPFFVIVIIVINLLRNTSLKRAKLHATNIENFVIKNKRYFNFTSNALGQLGFAISIVGATCNYVLGGKMAITVGFIILGIAIRWLYSKFIVA